MVPPSPSPPLVVVEVVVLMSEPTKSGVPPVGLVVSVVGLMSVLWVMCEIAKLTVELVLSWVTLVSRG